MERVAQHDRRAGVDQFGRRHRLDGAIGSHRHDTGVSTVRAQGFSRPRRAAPSAAIRSKPALIARAPAASRRRTEEAIALAMPCAYAVRIAATPANAETRHQEASISAAGNS